MQIVWENANWYTVAPTGFTFFFVGDLALYRAKHETHSMKRKVTMITDLYLGMAVTLHIG